ncbi:MAG: DEAD/DEAH box helicase [Nitrospira sp.]|nr:DEAD/DEAH box helicase [Nitrospira sp.]
MTLQYLPGSLVRARGREWVVLPESKSDLLRLRPLGGAEDDATLIYLPLEQRAPKPATFLPPDPNLAGTHANGLLLRDSLRLKLRAGAGPFRSFGNLAVEPRAYQLVPLLMALKQETVRLLIADDVGIGKTIEAALIARELIDRGEIQRFTVLSPPHLCEQWQEELSSKFNVTAEVVRTGTASRLERGLPAGQSIFNAYPFTVVSLDYIKSDRRRDEFARACPEFVIVEEAHTCVQGGTSQRHQRYQLLKTLAENTDRHLVMLTATPHSGNEEAFYNLLSLLRPQFKSLQELTGTSRTELRRELGNHFVQRRRPDIAEWHDSTVFPDRQTREVTYSLTGEWGKLFQDVLTYARTMVREASDKSLVQQRMNWWAALALLRCISSSPAAASVALRTRIKAVEGATERQQIEELDAAGMETVLDGESDDLLSQDEAVPAGQPESAAEESAALRTLIDRAEKLKGPKHDPKLAGLIRQLEELVADGFSPVVFCRYIATAHYLAEQLRLQLDGKNVLVKVVTGELTPEERKEEVHNLDTSQPRILVATDCLSEGINLQSYLDAVVHYDLSWNPTRHEQREGRVDRFGQPKTVVRSIMYYGDNNPIDGAVLRVILQKAERIRKELGVAVPLPADSNKVMQAVLEAVLLRGEVRSTPTPQLDLEFGKAEQMVEAAWQSAKEKAKESRTIFAQRSLHPEQVLPEWDRTVNVLGGEKDVERFVTHAARQLEAPLEVVRAPSSAEREMGASVYKLPLSYLPSAVRERLEGMGIKTSGKPFLLAFEQPTPAGVEFIHRTHPLVSTLAEHITELALSGRAPEVAARCGAIFTEGVKTKATVYLLRLRSQITAHRHQTVRNLLAEECLTVTVAGGAAPQLISGKDALGLMAAPPARNMAPEQRSRLVQSALDALPSLEPAFNELARARAKELLADHRRVREASEARGWRYEVEPSLPMDVIGVYVLMPATAM